VELGRSHTSTPLQIFLTAIYLITTSLGLVMGEYKTIISANIPVSLADRLKNKTKGTRSRVIERALTAYLNDKDAFDITDVETRSLMIHLKNREEISEQLRVLLMMELGY
jgi:hypothetical protein